MKQSTTHRELTIDRLVIYPVKGLAGVDVAQVNATASGLEYDRQWVILRPDNSVLSQRTQPEMVLIQPEIQNGQLLLKNTLGQTIELSIGDDAEYVNIPVWKDTCVGQIGSQNTNEWITQTLHSPTPLRLARIAPNTHRKYFDPHRFNVDVSTYADAAPYLLANTQSLEALNHALKQKNEPEVDYRHFRANIWLSGLEAFTEHHTHCIATSNGSPLLKLIDHCSRCVVITIEPDTGKKRDKASPFKTLAQLNSIPSQAKVPAFGVNSIYLPTDNVQLKVNQQLVSTYYPITDF